MSGTPSATAPEVLATQRWMSRMLARRGEGSDFFWSPSWA